ncbi:glycoside hydrolase family 20 protein [Tamlana sp. 2201CG12-4]|uniref:glycoside hydrolase family 20 protein n=1 Tax=Tamlana sp. 2201CG12-4 TaxID=3112582 RepID=UPI002DBE952A|nr:glycoside hydrolase family 20 protein [Tamlana sp. 2201CG12-4]MEC3907186.1 glycoside hydrolase family 20 protein [Tamlana sp. 2201CG12-4]
MKRFNQIILLALVVILSSCSERKEFTENDIRIIPRPAELKILKGVFEFSEKTKFVVSNEDQREISNALIKKFKKAAGWNLEALNKKIPGNYIRFVENEEFEDEAYKLEVDKDKITITAKGNAGFIYGLESIRQLLPEAIESSEIVSDVEWIIPNVTITDKPRFKWRGLMLDVSRHFFDKDYIKQVIDGLVMHKMNVLHLHLIDDQGWRIEIKKYPELTNVGAWRVDQEDKHWNARDAVSPDEKGTYGGFFTQEELKELVAYAQSRNVEIIPEIEMPAHVTSAIAAYPELSCLEKPVGVPSGGVWPITDIYCAGKDSTFEFLENVLIEVMNIFPSKYIHIGGDEATKTNWKTCPNCKKRMKTEGLHDVEELQSYFIKRMEKFINSYDKKLVGWDEILEGGLAPDATVMSWRGVKGGLEAAAQGHDVVMTPGTHCYFDHYQGPQNEEPLAIGGFTPLSKVYEFDPVVETMTETEASHVLGGQANLWAEYIPTTEHSEYMTYPRLAALAETVWSPKALRDWNNFSNRIVPQFKRYEFLGINYAKSAYLVTSKTDVDLENKSVSLLLQNEFPNADIRYVFGNGNLNEEAIKYTSPIELQETTIIKASLFKNDKPVGKVFVDTITFHKAVAHKVNYITPYSDKYQGAGAFGMVNTLRGTKNFHDGQWQAWLGQDMEVVIDLEEKKTIKEVSVGALENQGPDIYFPTAVEVSVSNDGKTFDNVGRTDRAFVKNAEAELKDFKISFKERKVRFVKVKAICLEKSPKGGGAWLFVDEILLK